MYKLILADDEEDVREGVLAEIDWEHYGFEVVDIAENGREAQELIEKHAPDVVVTDIQMPFMDGLQLSEWIRANYPTTKVIILTGFDEFEYAQKAVKLHIDEYVLKPFSSQELIQILVKVKGQIEEETAQKENMQALQEHYRASLPVMRQVFLGSLISRKMSRHEIADKSALYGLDLSGDGFLASVISIDSVVRAPNEKPEAADASRSVSLKETKDSGLKCFAVLNIAEEIIGKYADGLVFINRDHVVLLTRFSSLSRPDAFNRTVQLLEEVRQSIEKYLKFTATIGVGTFCEEVPDVQYSYQDAVLALDYRSVLGNNRIICIDDVESRFNDKVRFDELKEQSLTRCIKVGTVTELQEIIDQLFGELIGSNISYQDYQFYLLEIITAILRAAKDANIDLEEVLGANFMPFAEIHRFNNLQEAKVWVAGLCARIMETIVTDRQSSYVKLVDQAKEFTKEHFHETDISINKVCSHLHISTGYFSSIFKKETRMTFVGYLMQLRMETAKQFLRTTDMKAFEIAEKVGFADPNYFSFCFRKHTGISPKEYRNSSRG